ncbi:MAG TPA: acyltransferase, partial [Mycobacteriales bacterium]|nr:acyltransferase [Mycobacteriales bacterium]
MTIAAAAAQTKGRDERDLTRGHLYQVDIVRLLTFLAVMAVHSVAFTQTNENEVAGGVLMVLQFGRELFFALTGFVLVHAARRPTRLWPFWRKRFTYVLVPYLGWSAIYIAYRQAQSWAPPLTWHGFWWDLLTGGAQYHLYFLLVSMQLYAVFPWLLRFLRATAAHAVSVLAVVSALNLGWLALLHFGQVPAGGAGRTVWI